MGLQPFLFCQKESITRYMKEEPITINTLMDHSAVLTELVKKTFSLQLPNMLAIVVDGWSCAEMHCVAILASFPDQTRNGFQWALLAFSPMGKETRLDADDHVSLRTFVLVVFKKDLSFVVAIRGDICATNRSIAKMLGALLFAVRAFVTTYLSTM